MATRPVPTIVTTASYPHGWCTAAEPMRLPSIMAACGPAPDLGGHVCRPQTLRRAGIRSLLDLDYRAPCASARGYRTVEALEIVLLAAARFHLRGSLVSRSPLDLSQMSRILYIGGCARSGSTLVDRLLGQLPGFVPTGELALITINCIGANRLCGCGRRFRDCPYWQAVGEAAFGGWDCADVGEMVTLHPQVTRQRHIPLLIFPGLSPGFDRKLRRYRALLRRLYAAVSSVSGAEVVVELLQDSGLRPCTPWHPRS